MIYFVWRDGATTIVIIEKMQSGFSPSEIGKILRSPIVYQRGYNSLYYPRIRYSNRQFGRGFGTVLSSLARYFFF